jgi:hypothetical protein
MSSNGFITMHYSPGQLADAWQPSQHTSARSQRLMPQDAGIYLATTQPPVHLQLSQFCSTFASSRSFSTTGLDSPRRHTVAHSPSRACSRKSAAALLTASLLFQTEFFLVTPSQARDL